LGASARANRAISHLRREIDDCETHPDLAGRDA
jgi:hypothetical protein